MASFFFRIFNLCFFQLLICIIVIVMMLSDIKYIKVYIINSFSYLNISHSFYSPNIVQIDIPFIKITFIN